MAGEPRRDLYGDPLPDGAIMRFGTVQRRLLGPTQLAITPDGKMIVGLCGGRYVQYWDAETLKLKEQFELPGIDADTKVVEGAPSAASGKTAIAPNGKCAARCRFDSGSLEFWDLEARKRLSQVPIPKEYDDVLGIAFSSNSQILALLTGGNKAAAIRFVSVSSAKQYEADAALAKESRGNFATFAFSPDSTSFVASFGSQPLVCWDTATGKVKWHSSKDARFVAYFANGRHVQIVATVKTGDDWVMLDSRDGTPVDFMKLPKRIPDYGAAVAPDNRTLLMKWESEIELWDMEQGRSRGGLPVDISPWMYPERSPIVFPDEQTVVTAFMALQRWDIGSGRRLDSDPAARGHIGWVERLAFAPNGSLLASRAADGSIRIWDLETGQERHKHELARDKGWGSAALAFADGGRRLVYVRMDSLGVWDADTGRRIVTRQLPEAWLPGACLTADGTKVIRVDRIKGRRGQWSVTFVDVLTGIQHSSISFQTGNWFPHGVSPTGAWLTTDDGRLLDLRTGERGMGLVVAPDEALVDVLAVSPDGRFIAGRIGEVLDGGAFAKPGQRSVWPLDRIRVWESASGRELVTFASPDEGYRMEFKLAAFHPGLRTLVIAKAAGLHMVSLPSGEQSLQIPAHQQYPLGLDWVYATVLAWSPDGKALATGHPDGTILLWDVSKIKREPPRKLTFTECDICWNDLMAHEPAKAYKAIFQLADSPETALLWLREKLKPAFAVPRKELDALVTDLGSADFKTREAAQQRLGRFGDRVEAGLQAATKGNLSVEQRRRAQTLLDALAPTKAPPPEMLREIRAVAALEYMKTPEARQFVEELAKGLESARLTREAKESLSRLKKN
jgi:WD40 repeat protein